MSVILKGTDNIKTSTTANVAVALSGTQVLVRGLCVVDLDTNTAATPSKVGFSATTPRLTVPFNFPILPGRAAGGGNDDYYYDLNKIYVTTAIGGEGVAFSYLQDS